MISKEEFEEHLMAIVLVTFIGLVIFGLWSCRDEVFADEIPEETAIRCIVGEAANQGEQGMLALAEALRNRGTTKGVYGCKAQHINKQPSWVFTKARQAWRQSLNSNLTNGAKHWENVKAFGEPYWAKKMVKTYEYKDHTFYKEVL